MKDVTRILQAIEQGNTAATEELLPLLYAELRDLARSRLARFPNERTLQPTALVHEAYLRLVGSDAVWENRGHFFAAAARVMWQILVEKARSKKTLKRGQGNSARSFDDIDGFDIGDVELGLGERSTGEAATDVLALDAAFDALGRDSRPSRVAMLRYVAGLTVEEISGALDISISSVERDWRFARAFLYKHLSEDGE